MPVGTSIQKFNLIVAVCENLGIGLKGDLPWKLRFVNIFLNMQ